MSEDRWLEQTLGRFREVEPPENVRSGNRQAVRVALERPHAAPWWQRSLAVPVPVVLAGAAVLLLSLSVHMIPMREMGGSSLPDIPAEGRSTDTGLLPTGNDGVEYSETQQYVSGVGIVNRELVFAIRE